jgi:signal transduction histidine kinase/CheY-like chemotaxis protein
VALFGDPQILATGLNLGSQLAVQLLGAITCFGLSFGLILALLKLMNRFYPLRIHLNAERMGLNFETHHLASEHSQLLQEIDQIKHASKDHNASLNIDPLSDMAELAAQYNVLLREANLARNQAQTAAQAKTNFLATMSHEIRTPMNGVMGMVELLQQTDLNQEQGELAQVVAESGSTLLHIINDILDYSKIEAGQLEVENIAFNLASEISTVNKLMQPKAQYKGLSLSVNIAQDLPSVLLGDPNRLRQILFNLVGNAIKFTHTGHITINVTRRPSELTHESKASHIRIEVVDTGIGLTEETQNTLFMPFSQADSSTTRVFGGTGLGLSICSQLVELMGGSIGLHRQLNLGSTFWFELPLQEAPLAAQQATALSQPGFEVKTQAFEPPSDTVAIANNIMILIAEDNPVNLRVMQKMLYRLGYASTAVKDGQAAWQAVNEGMFGLLLTDCHMPELDGYQLTHKIRQHLDGEQLPIIAVTASVLAKDVQKARDVGMDDFLTKPITLAALDAVVQTYLPKAAEFRQIQSDGAPQQPILDEGRLSQLFGDDLAVKQEMLQLFVDSTQSLVEQLQGAIEQNDDAALKQAAHSISGAAGVTGAMDLSRICSTIEKAVSERNLAVAWHHAQQVNASFEQLKQTIQQQQATQFDPTIPAD